MEQQPLINTPGLASFTPGLPVNGDRGAPVVGAAMHSREIPAYLDWLVDDRRDLEIQDAIEPELLEGDWLVRARTVKHLLSGYPGRLGMHGPFLSLPLMARDPKIRTVVIDRLRQGLEFAEVIGATHMVAHSPFDFFGHPFLEHTPAAGLDEQIELVHATLDPILPLLAAINCTLVIETIHDRNPRPLLTLIDSLPGECVRMSLDVGHAFIGHQGGGPTPDQWVLEAGPRLGHVHLQDTDGRLDRHWPPGIGAINWHALFRALAEVDSDPRLIIEMKQAEDIPVGAQWLAAAGLAR